MLPGRVGRVGVPLLVDQQEDDVLHFDEDGGSDDDSDNDSEATVVSRSGLPENWSVEVQALSTGREVKHYYGPNGEYSRSMVGAWRVQEAANLAAQDAAPMGAEAAALPVPGDGSIVPVLPEPGAGDASVSAPPPGT